MTGVEQGSCRSCGGDLVRALGRTYHPWDVTRSCSERVMVSGHAMADVNPGAFISDEPESEGIVTDVQEIFDALTKRAEWHPQSRGRNYGLCNAGSHSQLENVPCSIARPLRWLYDMLEHPLGPCPRCDGKGWIYGEDERKFDATDCPRCSAKGLRGGYLGPEPQESEAAS